MTDQSLTVDRAAAAVQLSRDDVRAWAADKRVFISSVMHGLEAERRAVADAIRELGAEPIWFEEFGARDQDPEEAYLSEVDLSDVYAGILGSRYGRQDPGTGFSATHAEYLRAVERGLRLGVWVLDVDDMAGHQRDFLSEVRTYFTTETVDGAERLASRVVTRLEKIAAEDMAPWCQVGKVIFRAKSVRDEGDNLIIDSQVRDRDVLHRLKALRPDGFGGARPIEVVFADTALAARPVAVEVEIVAGSSARVTVKLARNDRQGGLGGFGEASYNTGTSTYTPADLTEIGLRSMLFGAPNPLGPMRFMAEVPDVLDELRRAAVTEENLRPILRLKLVEALVGAGRASRVIQLLVGPRGRDGSRRLRLEWEEPASYGQPGGRRSVEGAVLI